MRADQDEGRFRTWPARIRLRFTPGLAACKALSFTPNLRRDGQRPFRPRQPCACAAWRPRILDLRAGPGPVPAGVVETSFRRWFGGRDGRGAVNRRRGRIGFGRRQLAGVIRAPFADFILQLPVLLGKFFQLLLRGGRARQRHHVRRQLLFATVNVLLDDLRVVGIGIELQILLVMINRRGGIGGLFFVQPAEFIMRRRRMGIRLQRLLERFNRALIIHGVDPAFAQDKMRLLFLAQRAWPRRRATAQREPEQYDTHTAGQPIQNDMT